MPTCETCKWWGRCYMKSDNQWRRCSCQKTRQRVSDYPHFHRNFGCIHHQPKEAEDE